MVKRCDKTGQLLPRAVTRAEYSSNERWPCGCLPLLDLTGIWHTGIIVYGKEYFFGGGLQSMPHEQFVQMHGGVGPTEYIELGSTDLTQVWVNGVLVG